jgi:hypothetical protein
MRKQIILTALIASFVGVAAAQAQEPRDFSMRPTQTVQLPGMNRSIVFNSPELQVGKPRDAAELSDIVSSWLSANFGLPAMRHAPHVAHAETAKSVTYDGRSRTIYLPISWNGSSPQEMSAFVREMARHLQSQGGANYHCEPTQFANAAQVYWLAMFGVGERQGTAPAAVSLVPRPRCTFRQSQVEK